MKTWIYDVEQFKNYHSCSFLNTTTKEIRDFVIHRDRNDITEYLEFLNSDQISHLVGYNNISYDYPMIHSLMNMDHFTLPEYIAYALYDESQFIIDDQWSSIAPWDVKIRQVDLFKIHHFDNKAKRTSLKALQFALRMKTLEDLPFHHTSTIEKHQIDTVLQYCHHDLWSTYEFFLESEDLIKLRVKNSNKYNIDLLNASDSKMGESIFLHYIEQETGLTAKTLKATRPDNNYFSFEDCILDYIEFETPALQRNLENTKNLSVYNDKELDISNRVVVNGFPYDFGGGGIHGVTKSGIYRKREGYSIKSCDVKSYYPNLAIVNQFYPQHIGPEFCRIYKMVYDERSNYPKSTHFAENYSIKISLNAVYGKSNDQYSPLRDLMYMYKITLNGQFLLVMLAEKLQLAGIKMLMINTDGLECEVPDHLLPVYQQICEWWEKLTNLELEFDEYESLIIRDVNNYTGKTIFGSIKEKGAFEIDKDWHKNHSFLIIPIALQKYFHEEIPVKDSIDNLGVKYIKNGNTETTNLYDYCGLMKMLGEFKATSIRIDGNRLIEKKHQKNNRYYISKNGQKIYKDHPDGRRIAVESKWTSTIINEMPDDNFFDKIDKRYYKIETKKIINAVTGGGQLSFV